MHVPSVPYLELGIEEVIGHEEFELSLEHVLRFGDNLFGGTGHGVGFRGLIDGPLEEGKRVLKCWVFSCQCSVN